MNVYELDQMYVAHTYKRFPVEIVSGKGSLVKDVSGKEYIDIHHPPPKGREGSIGCHRQSVESSGRRQPHPWCPVSFG